MTMVIISGIITE